jgi:flagellar biosynthesis anti-sigma factor FlgM
MRIDPKTQISGNQQSEAISDSKTSSGQRPATNAPTREGVQVQLSTDSAQVSQLAQQATGAPPVRTERVQALQQSIRNGNFNVTNEQIAAAMYGDMFQTGTEK